jgi:hypothetical protein
MKINFRKIASVLTGAVMLSSTVAFAAAANFPAPFVKSGAGDYAVVYGSTAVAGTDNVAAADINAFLTGKVTTTTSTPSTGDLTLSDGDVVQLEKSNDKFNLGEDLNDFSATIDSDDLPVVLADGVYTNDAGDDFDYEQDIVLANNVLGWQQDGDYNDDMPFIGFDLTSGDTILNYTLDFSDAAESSSWSGTSSDLQGTVIKMLGREYYISDVAYSASTGVALTLLDTANSVRISEGDTQTLSVGDKNYEVKVLAISDDTDDSVSLSINGVELSTDLEEGDTAKIKGEETYVGVKKISVSSKESVANTAVITIGTGQLVLENGEEVELNGDPLSDATAYEDHLLTAYITNSSFDVEEVKLEWKLKDDAWLSSGSSLVLPGFEAVKLSMGNFVTSANEVSTLENSGSDQIVLSTEVTDGTVDLPIVYNNATGIIGIGKDSDEKLVTSANSTIVFDGDTDKWFVVSRYNGDEFESYVLEVSDIDSYAASNGANTTTIKSAAGTKSIDIDIGDTEEFGDISLTLLGASETTEQVVLQVTGTGTLSFDELITAEGLHMQLPVATTGSGDGSLNVTISPASWVMNFTEEDEDDNIHTGLSFTATLGQNSEDDAEISAVSVTDYETEDGSDNYKGYVISALATETLWKTGGDQDSLDITYHGSEAYAQVYLTESTVSFNEDGSSGGGSSGTMVVKDSEVSSVQTKNLIVVGGSCVNTVAAKLLNSDVPLCGDDWTAKTNAGAGAFLIETYANPWSTGKVATLVAGYDATDSTNAVNALKTETIDTTVGKKYVKLAGSTLQLV